MKKNIISLVLTTIICASIMLAVMGIYRFFAEPILKKPEELPQNDPAETVTQQIYYNPLLEYCQE